MAQTAPAPTPTAGAAPKPGKKKSLIVAAAVGVIAVALGAITPLFMHFGADAAPPEPEVSRKPERKQVLIPFDSLVVNVADGRYTRYLRVRISLVVDARDESKVKELVEKEKPFLQTWVLGYLQDRTIDQLHGSAGMHRVQRELRDEFNRRLFPDGPERIRDILLPEYNFQ